jgi:hypothetical protein
MGDLGHDGRHHGLMALDEVERDIARHRHGNRVKEPGGLADREAGDLRHDPVHKAASPEPSTPDGQSV